MDYSHETSSATMVVEAELKAPLLTAQLVRFDIPEPTESILLDAEYYHLNMCLTPRPLVAKAGFIDRWGPHRFDPLGDIFLIPPGERLCIKGGTVRQASLICQLHPEAIRDVLGEELDWTEPRLASALDISSARIRALMFRITEEVRHPGLASQRMAQLFCGELAIELGRYCLELQERPVTGGLAGWRLRLIDERLDKETTAPSLEELAAICNVSVRQLTRGFRVSRGCTIGDYIERHRMEAGKRLLMKGGNIKSVAFALGYSSPSSFAFAFRRAVGISPSQFRQRQSRAVNDAAMASGN